MQEWGASALNPVIFIRGRLWVTDLGSEQEGGHNGNQMFGLCAAVWPGSSLPCTQECVIVLWSPCAPAQGGEGSHMHTHTRCTHARSPHRQPWLCSSPLPYLPQWPWKTKQVLSTFDFSAFKLILSAQLLKQLSSPAVSNFRLGTFAGCQVLSLHCESLAAFLSIVTIWSFF